MIYFKRFLWLAAWSVWVWLGFGLYRELPRQPKPAIATIPLESDDTLLGFVKDTPYAVVQSSSSLPESVQEKPRDPKKSTSGFRSIPQFFKVFDAHTAKQVRETAPGLYRAERRPQALRTHGVLFVSGMLPGSTVEGASSDKKGLFAYDVMADRWLRVSDFSTTATAVHPTKPWIVLEGFRFAHPQRRPAVVDWSIGAELLAFPSAPINEQFFTALFIGDSDRVIVSRWESLPNSKSFRPGDLEFWKIGLPSRLVRVLPSPSVGDSPRMVSKSGRTIFIDCHPESLWNIETGALLWTPDGTQDAEPDDAGGTFSVFERWAKHWGGPHKNGWNTAAQRDLETAGLKFRCWESDSSILELTNVDDTLGVSATGSVHRLPFVVDWTLLVLCQTILALPLILFWAVLRWRRKRKAIRAAST